MKKIVIIGGGTGTSTLLKGLKKYNVDLSVIVSTADDGGSTGKLREEFGVLPPGDMRQCLVALSGRPKEAEKFNFRFTKGPQKGHTVGNLILANLEKKYGVKEALRIASKALKVKGHIYPLTLKPTILLAILSDGKVIKGEHNIDERNGFNLAKISRLILKGGTKPNKDAIKAVKSADLIVFGPGDLYTSTLPNLLVKGMLTAIKKSKARKVFIVNLMTKSGQSDKFKASDFVRVLAKYMKGVKFSGIINVERPGKNILKLYKKDYSDFVEPDAGAVRKLGMEVYQGKLLSKKYYKKSKADKLKRSILRHDSGKLAKLIYKLL